MLHKALFICLALLISVGMATAISIPSFPMIRYGDVSLVGGMTCIEDEILVEDRDGNVVGSGKIRPYDSSCLYSVGIQPSAITVGNELTLRAEIYYDPVVLTIDSTQDIVSVEMSFPRNDMEFEQPENPAETIGDDSLEETEENMPLLATETFVPWHETMDGVSSSRSQQNEEVTTEKTEVDPVAGFIPAQEQTELAEEDINEKAVVPSSSSDSTRTQTNERTSIGDSDSESEESAKNQSVREKKTITVFGQSFQRIPFFAGISAFVIFTYLSGMVIALIVMRK